MILGLGNTIPSDSVRQGLGGGGGGGFDNTYSLAFDGVDDFVKASLVNGGSIIGGSKTISWWMKLDQYNTTEMIMSIRGTSGADYFSAWKTSSGQVRFGCRGAVTHGRSADTTKYDVTTLTDWTHFLVTKKLGLYSRGEIVKIFINGVDVTGGNTTVNGGIANEIKIGQIGNIGYMGSLLHGSVDELAVFDGELDSPAEVASIYNSGTPNDLTSLNPLVWYRMGDNGSYKSPQWLIPNNSNVANSRLSNYSFNFDGVDDFVDVGSASNLNFTGAFTLSVWAKKTGTGSGSLPTLFNSAKNSSNQGGYILCEVGSIWKFYVWNGSAWQISQADSTIVNDVWYNIIAIYDNSIIKLYVNGVLQADTETVASVGYASVNQNAFIGEYVNNHFNGNIDEIALWGSDQSSNVSSIYNSGTPTTITGATAYWKMGEEANFTDNWLVNNSALSNYSTRSFNFDGVDDEINCGDVLHNDGQTSMTVSAWVNVSTDGDYPIAGKKKVRSAPLYAMNGWDVTLDTSGVSKNKLAFQLIGVNSSGVLIGSIRAQANGFSFNDGLWHHVVVTYDGSEDASGVKFYRDGVEDTNVQILTNTLSGNSVNDPSVDFKIASRPKYSGSSFYNGSMDELAIWSTTALTQEQITTIYNSGTPARIEGATSYWRMGEDATFNTNWNVPDNIGSATGTSANMTIADLEGEAPNYTGGGLSANMTIEDRVGDAPNSTSNALSYNMTESDRVEDTPPS